MVNNWLNINRFLPCNCLLCDTPMEERQELALCQPCTLSLPWLRDSCYCCGLPLQTDRLEEFTLCGSCQHEPPPFQQCHPLFHYHYPIDKLITRLKFNQQLIYARLLGLLMAQHIRYRYREQALPDILIPVPLHKNRLRERGFNQSQEVASVCARKLGIKLADKHCRRQRQTQSQLGLSATERRRNIRNAFISKSFTPNTNVALLDDVMTTGTTLNELSRCLKTAGCEEIHLWCVARAQ